MTSRGARKHGLSWWLKAIASASAVAITMSACGGSPSSSPSTASKDEVSVSLYSVPNGIVGWIPYGIKEGIYEKHGIDLKIRWAAGAAGATGEVVGGQSQFGLSSADSIISARDTGSDVRMFMGVTQRPFNGVFVQKDSGITHPSQLKGHKIAVAKGSTTFKLFPLFLEHYGLAPSDVETLPVAESALVAMFRAGQADGFISGVPGYGPYLNLSGTPVSAFPYADAGVPGLGYGLIASQKTLSGNADLARRMAAATAESMEAAYANPQAAAQATVEGSPASKLDIPITAASVTAVKEYDHTDNTEGQPRGWMSEDDWKASIALAEEFNEVKPGIKPSDMYTNDLISGAGRNTPTK
jgi:NitT/TauT family transport system substrate-binding protein